MQCNILTGNKSRLRWNVYGKKLKTQRGYIKMYDWCKEMGAQMKGGVWKNIAWISILETNILNLCLGKILNSQMDCVLIIWVVMLKHPYCALHIWLNTVFSSNILSWLNMMTNSAESGTDQALMAPQHTIHRLSQCLLSHEQHWKNLCHPWSIIKWLEYLSLPYLWEYFFQFSSKFPQTSFR